VPARSCVVSFIDPDGLQHSTKVRAETLYEAAVLAILPLLIVIVGAGSANGMLRRLSCPVMQPSRYMTKAIALASDNPLFPLAGNWPSLSDRSFEAYENGRRPKAAATLETMQETIITLVYDHRWISIGRPAAV